VSFWRERDLTVRQNRQPSAVLVDRLADAKFEHRLAHARIGAQKNDERAALRPDIGMMPGREESVASVAEPDEAIPAAGSDLSGRS